MVSDRGQSSLRRSIYRFPTDLAFVIVLTVLTSVIVVLPGARETPIRMLLGMLFLLFFPGYAFIAALFPETGELPESNDEEDAHRAGGIDQIERTALALGTSITIVPIIGLLLNSTPWGIRLAPILLSVNGFTVLCAIVAAFRRWELPPENRFSVSDYKQITAGSIALFSPADRTDVVLNVVLVLSIVLAVGAMGFALVVPQQDERFTEFYLLTENDDSELVTANYPDEFIQGEGQSLVIGIENQEYEPTKYTVITQINRVKTEDDRVEVIEREEVDRFSVSLDHDETWHTSREVTPTLTGRRLRLTYLLYEGEAPKQPTRKNAYRDVHLWITVEERQEENV